MKGIFEFEVNGETRGLKFSTYALAVACEACDNCTVDELFEKIGVSGNQRVSPMSLSKFFYGAAVAYAESKNLKVDFKVSHVSDWMDEIGVAQVNKVLIDGLKQYVPKNSNSLSEKGEIPVTQ